MMDIASQQQQHFPDMKLETRMFFAQIDYSQKWYVMSNVCILLIFSSVLLQGR